MNIPQPAPVRKPKQSIRERLPKHRDDSGLTTLEWLLIVAAVAGLAALAVVLVTQVVSETGEQIAGHSARLTSASLAADNIEQDLLLEVAAAATTELDSAAEGTAFAADSVRLCGRLTINYSDLPGIAATWDWNGEDDGAGAAPITKAGWTAALLSGNDKGCVVTADAS